MKGIIPSLLAVLSLTALSGCVTEVHEYRTHISEPKITVENETNPGFHFRTVANPLPETEQTSSRYAVSKDYGRLDPALIPLGSAPPRFEPYSRIGNNDYEVFGQSYKVWRDIEQYSEEGTASWYGPGFHGRFTSNGEIYDQYAISAAHKHLPIPCYVRVTNKENGRSLIVRINDRGPFHDNRILDLSYGAAQRLGIVGQGIAKVRLDLVHPSRPANADQLIAQSQAKTIQLLATDSASRAREEASRLSQKFGTPITIVNANQMYRLHMGPLAPQQADAMLTVVRDAGLRQAYFVY